MWRRIYTAVLYSALPFFFLRLVWKRLHGDLTEWQRGSQQLGSVPRQSGALPLIWIHAVSVGEVNAATPIVNELLKEQAKNCNFLITTTTMTGKEVVERSFGGQITHLYFPVDLPMVLRLFLNRVRPAMLILLEREIWPNLLVMCKQRNIKVLLINARLSENSFKTYKLGNFIIKPTLSSINWIGAQSASDVDRFVRLGYQRNKIEETGNIKFDLALQSVTQVQRWLPAQVWGSQRHVWIAASTHEGEEALVLQSLARLYEAKIDVMLILVPRHPQRFDQVAALCRRSGFVTIRRSSGKVPDQRTQIFLADSMGELPGWYACAHVAFVGGSLVPVGGHNLLEPAALGIPVLCGPYVDNWRDIVHQLVDGGHTRWVRNSDELASNVKALLLDHQMRQYAAIKGKEIIARNCGATQRTITRIIPMMPWIPSKK